MKIINPLSDLSKIKIVDIIAGLSIAGLLLPEAVAYSSIADLPPQMGIIALFAGLLCYGLLGSSRFAIVSATSSSAVVLATATAYMAQGDMGLRVSLSIALVLISGVFFLVAALARLGSITDFIAKPVLRGFAFGLAIVIIIKQFASIVGVHSGQSNLFLFVRDLFINSKEWNLYGLMLSAIALALLFLLSRFKRVPGALIVIALGIIASKTVDLSDYHIHLVGNMDLRVAKPSIPSFNSHEWLQLGELGLALSMILYSESYGSIRNFAVKHGDNTYPNRDLFALGVSNVVSGLFHGMPVAAGYSGTSANEAAGATSRWAGLIAILVILIIIVSLLPFIAFIPEPVLAAIVIYAVSHTLNPSVFKPYFLWKRDRVVLLAAIIGVFFLGVLDGLLVAIVISIVLLLKRLAESKISILGQLGETHNYVKIELHPDAKEVKGILIFRPDQPLFFANCDRILNQARHFITKSGKNVGCVILSLEESSDIDSTALEGIKEFFAYIIKQKKHLVIARLKEPVHELLTKILPSDSSSIYLSDLSVDDAVMYCNSNGWVGTEL